MPNAHKLTTIPCCAECYRQLIPFFGIVWRQLTSTPACPPLGMYSAQSGTDVLCIKHGGGKRCLVAGCQKLVRKNNRCTKHASMASEALDTPSRPQPAPLPPPPLPPAPPTLSPLTSRAAAMKIAAAAAPPARGGAATIRADPCFERKSAGPVPVRMPHPVRYQALPSPSSEYGYREANPGRSSDRHTGGGDGGGSDDGGGGGGGGNRNGDGRGNGGGGNGGGGGGGGGGDGGGGGGNFHHNGAPRLPRPRPTVETPGAGSALSWPMPPLATALSNMSDARSALGGGYEAPGWPRAQLGGQRAPARVGPPRGQARAFEGEPGVVGALRGQLSLNGNGLPRFPPPADIAASDPSSRHRHLPGTMEPRSAGGRVLPPASAAASVAAVSGSSELPHISAAAQLLSLGAASQLNGCVGASSSVSGSGGGSGGGGGGGGVGVGIVDDTLTLSNREIAASTSLALSRSNSRYKGFGNSATEIPRYPPPPPPSLPLQALPAPPPPALASAASATAVATAAPAPAAVAPRTTDCFPAPGVWPRDGHVGGRGGGESAPSNAGVARARANTLSASVFAEKGPLLAEQSSSPALSLIAPMAPGSALDDSGGAPPPAANGSNNDGSNSANDSSNNIDSNTISNTHSDNSNNHNNTHSINNSDNRVQSTGRSSPSSGPAAAAAVPPGEFSEAPITPLPIQSSCCGGQASVSGGVPPERATRPADAMKKSESRSPPPLAPTYISLSVAGMMCMDNCGQAVQRALSVVEGVRSVTVHFPTRTASVQVGGRVLWGCCSDFHKSGVLRRITKR